MRALIPLSRVPPLWFRHLPKLHFYYHLWVVRFQHEFCRNINIQTIAMAFCIWKDMAMLGIEELFYECKFLCLLTFPEKFSNCMSTQGSWILGITLKWRKTSWIFKMRITTVLPQESCQKPVVPQSLRCFSVVVINKTRSLHHAYILCHCH